MLPAEFDYLRDLAARLTSARHGEKTPLIETASRYLACSKQEIYRRLERAGFNSGRKPRTDRGTTCVPESIAKKAAGMVMVAARANGKKTLPIKDTLDILTENGEGIVDTETGEITPLRVSASTLSRAMKQYNCHPEQLRQPPAYTPQASLHPNHVWQIDASLCILFYLSTGGLAVMDEKDFYKNKPKNVQRIEKERVTRFAVSCHYSGCFYHEYFFGGESAESLTTFFLHAIQKRPDEVMHGVPRILMMDKGSANLSGLFLNLLDRLGIRHIAHLPGNPRAKGQIEKTHDIIECRFESRLAFHKVRDLAELNALGTRWRTVFCATAIHTRHRRTRNEMWLTIMEDKLRLAPSLELCQELVSTRPVEVTVRGDRTIRYNFRKGEGVQTYDVRYIPGAHPKTKLQVVINPYRAPAVDILTEDESGQPVVYTVEPVARRDGEFLAHAAVIGEAYQGVADSPADMARKEIYKDAYHAETEQAVDTARRNKKPAYEGDIDIFADLKPDSVPTYIRKRGRDLTLDGAHREIAPLNHVDAAQQLKSMLGENWTRMHYQWLLQRYPDGVPVEQIEPIALQLQGAMVEKVQPLKIAAGGA